MIEARLDGAARLEAMCRDMRSRLYADSMAACVRRWAEQTPDRLCVADPDEAMTYGAFWQRVLEKAGALRLRGIGPGDRVLARTVQRGDFLALQFAVHLLGGVFIPAARLRPGLLLQDSRLERAEAYLPPDMPKPGDTATILYTTGTTGQSKGIVLSHRAEVAVAQNVFYGTEMEPDTVELIPMPISHSYGLRHVFGLLLGGRSAVLCDGVTMAGDFFGLMDRWGVNAVSLTPAAVNVLRRVSGDRLGRYADRLRYIRRGRRDEAGAARAAAPQPPVPVLQQHRGGLRLHPGFQPRRGFPAGGAARGEQPLRDRGRRGAAHPQR